MSFAPATLLDLRAYLAEMASVSVANFGIVGDLRHCRGYHLGKDRVAGSCACKPSGTCVPGQGSKDYSVQHARDKAGLSDAASAIDIKFGTNYALLRDLSVFLVERAKSGNPDCDDIREIVYSPDGVNVLRWDRDGIPGGGDSRHLYHSHVSYRRDSELHDKLAPYRAYFEGEVMVGFKGPYIGMFTIGQGHSLIPISEAGKPSRRDIAYGTWPTGSIDLMVIQAIDLRQPTTPYAPMDIEGRSPPVDHRDECWLVDLPQFGFAALALRGDGIFTPTYSADALKLERAWETWLTTHPTL